MMNVLVIGGTGFLGSIITQACIDQGWAVTTFHRGKMRPSGIRGATSVTGERKRDLNLLAGRRWDSVIDTCGYVPRDIEILANALGADIRHYTFVSSVSVYADMATRGVDESGALATLPDPAIEKVTGETYGALKALCEAAARRALPCPVLIVRPGLIVGPNDPTDRFTYWPVRLAQGGQVLVPADANAPVQFIDVRDLGGWIVSLVGKGISGVFNAVGPAQPMTLSAMLGRCAAAVSSSAEMIRIDPAFLLSNGVAPFHDVPLWVPPSACGFLARSTSKALNAGLTCRPVEDTARDTLAWARSVKRMIPLRAGLSHEREVELVQAWLTRRFTAP